MTIISEEKIYERWDTLPLSLREALTSEVSSDFLWKTCESEHLPEEKIRLIGRSVSHVLLGFVHVGDLAQEIKEATDINPQIAASIANALNERIFAPLKADLENVYAPPSSLSPKPLDTMQAKPMDTIKPIYGEPSRTVSPLSLTGLPSVVKTEPPKPPVPFMPTAPGAPSPKTAATEPAPIIIHEESGGVTAGSSRGFRFDMSQPKLSEMKPRSDAATKPAVIEFGGRKPFAVIENKPPIAPSQPQAKVNIIHYSEMKTNLDKPSVASGGMPGINRTQPSAINRAEPGREVKEITEEPLRAPLQPAPRNVIPPMPFQPPRPGISQMVPLKPVAEIKIAPPAMGGIGSPAQPSAQKFGTLSSLQQAVPKPPVSPLQTGEPPKKDVMKP